MAIASKRNFHLIILFVLSINLKIQVSGGDYQPLVLMDYGYGANFPMCAKRTSNGYGNHNAVDFTKKNFPANLPLYYCPITAYQRVNIVSESPIADCLTVSSGYGKCDEEVKPSIKLVKIDSTRNCGISGSSKLFQVGYHLCKLSERLVENKSSGSGLKAFQRIGNKKTEKMEYRLETDSMKELYQFCLENSGGVAIPYITYIQYRIISPTLLRNDALKEERFTNYPFTDDTYGGSYTVLNDLSRYFKTAKESYASNTANGIRYTTLAPPEDMPLRLLKAPFFHVLNLSSFYYKVMNEWDNVGRYIRKKAIQQLGEVKIVAGISKVVNENGINVFKSAYQFGASSVMWKLVYTEQEYLGMAIIFHHPESNFEWYSMPAKLCERSLCEEYGWTNMISDHLKSHIYCCEPDVIARNYSQLKSVPPLRLRENFKSLFHMAESECHDKNDQGEPALINIYDLRSNSSSLPVCAKELGPVNETVYSSPYNQYERDEFYCPPATEDAYYILENNQSRVDNACLFPNPRRYAFCERPVQPVMIRRAQLMNTISSGCVSGPRYSQLYDMTYLLCRYNATLQVTPLPYRKPVYTVCYNHDMRRTAYIDYSIHSPRLLRNPSLAEEWDFAEEFKTDSYTLFGNDFEIMRDNYKIVPSDKAGFFMEKNFLVPPQDMAFRVWKRAAFHYVNVKLMWPYRADAWNSINQYLRDLAYESFWEMEIKTGVLNEDDPMSSSIWWKLVHNTDQRTGIAIILHNVPYGATIERLCHPNVCKTHHWNFMIPDDQQDYVYCCPPAVIGKELGMYEFLGVLDGLYISNVVNADYKNKAASCEYVHNSHEIPRY